jgi:hypothetical protein
VWFNTQSGVCVLPCVNTILNSMFYVSVLFIDEQIYLFVFVYVHVQTVFDVH